MEPKVKPTRLPYLKMRLINSITNTLLLILMAFCFQFSVIGQNLQQDYLNTKQKKSSFDDSKYKGLKKQLIEESTSSKSGNGKESNEGNFNKEYPSPGNNYDYEKEDYKGEYDEYNYEYNPDYEDEDFYQPEYDDYEKGENDADPNTYDDYSNGYDYYEKDYNQDEYNDYQNKPEKSIKKDAVKNTESKNTAPPTSGEMHFMQVLLIIIGAALLAFVIYYFFMRFSIDEQGKKIEIEQDLPPMEIPKSELEKRLEAALASENYKEAVRIYFIFIIKGLSEKQWILWEKDKTNMYYLFEMRKRSQYDLFNQTVTIFEWVWYGNYTIEKEQFNKWEITFKKLLSDINNT